MAGSTMSFTPTQRGGITRIVIDWLSDDATGAVSGISPVLSGFLIKGQTDPGAVAPDDNYDIILTDPESVNVLLLSHDDLLNRDTANTEEVYFALQPDAATTVAAYPVVSEALTVAVTNAGNAKAGQIILYLQGTAA